MIPGTYVKLNRKQSHLSGIGFVDSIGLDGRAQIAVAHRNAPGLVSIVVEATKLTAISSNRFIKYCRRHRYPLLMELGLKHVSHTEAR